MRLVNFEGAEDYCEYSIADSIYLINQHYPEIDHLKGSNLKKNPILSLKAQQYPELVYQKKTLIGDKEYQLQVKSNTVLGFQLTIDEDAVLVDQNAISTESNLSSTLLFGPALILNLALNQVFCFHASSFKYKDNIFVVLADSGTGKSTIAEYFHCKYNSRIADDIIPMKKIDGDITLLPNFPQLKLSPAIQTKQVNYHQNIHLIFAKKSNQPTKMQPLNKFNAIKSIINHSVATKLFDSTLLAKHLSFCYQLSQQTKAYELRYQHSKNSLDDLCQILDDLD